ncbi:tripartite tricarboxylate transporter substrate-binding protein [Variovorax dokdonensis]|uniref:Tripartite tricarboxylate transporter substrate-binding protein n=1 Tax=Variovorax dokdonensis TaxID=344883 RepID=A0ABT7N4T0_9BURK|nr:tripartite tricarboxylate transporter substrate-binding protein [Variovorax dokdonensis]MDM0042923.1 tripartite tricarboxylate transporter substrate-binding protein [Variovorax dokdonensis]
MKSVLGFFLSLALFAGLPAQAQQDYPHKPIRIVVPYQAGQGTDVATRFLAEQLGRALGQAIVVDNKAGAGGSIGAADVARAAPDGYTLLMGTNGTHVLNQFLYPSIPFDPVKDFEPVALVSTFPMVVVANTSTSYKSLADLLAEAKAKPGAVSVGLPSTTARLVVELLQKQSGTKFQEVPYKGSGTFTTDLMGGQVTVGVDTASAARPFIASGKMKALAVTSEGASALLPGVDPVSATGMKGFQVVAYNGLYAPHGTPQAIVRKLNAEVAKILARPEAQKRLLELGHEVAGGTPEDLAAFARDERKKWEPIIEAAGMRAQ